MHASIHPSAGASCRRCRAIHANNQSSADPAVRGHAPHSDLVAIMGRSVALPVGACAAAVAHRSEWSNSLSACHARTHGALHTPRLVAVVSRAARDDDLRCLHCIVATFLIY